VLAVNQHGDLGADNPRQAENSADVAAFSDVVQFCTAGTLVVVDFAFMNPAKRAWCLYEWDQTLDFHGPDGLHFHGLSTQDRAKIVDQIDIKSAECWKDADKQVGRRGQG
jgi:hypothetical protein